MTELNFIGLAELWLKMYREQPTQFIEEITRGKNLLTIVRSAYTDLLKKKKILPIGKLTEAEKWDLFNQAKQWHPTATKEQNKNLCEALHALRFLTKQKASL